MEILKGFRRVMEEYGITQPEQIRAVATSSVREAENRDTFLDRIYIATRINVRAIDEAEESRLTYMAAQSVVESEPDLKDGNVLVVDVGGGSTELLLVQEGQVTFSDSYRLGSLRMREMLETQRAPTERVRTILGQHIQRHGRADQPQRAGIRPARAGRDVRRRAVRRGAALPGLGRPRARRGSTTRPSRGSWTRSCPCRRSGSRASTT